MDPNVSVIVPYYNAEKYIIRCAESLKKQKYTNFEILFIDDGSYDNTNKLLENFSSEDERFKVIHKENGGVSSARNVGLEKAKGRYIAFVDSDDWVAYDWLDTLVSGYEKKGQEVDIVGCNLIYRTEYCMTESPIESSFVDVIGTENILKYLMKHPMTRNNGLLGRPFVWNKLYRRDIINQHNIRFSEKTYIGEDCKFNYDYMKNCKLARFSKNYLYNYFQNPDSVMSSTLEKRNFSPKMMSWPEIFDDMYKDVSKHFPEISKCCEAIAVRLYIRCLVGMIYGDCMNKNFEKKALLFIKKHFRFKVSYDMDGTAQYLISAYVIKLNYKIWKLVTFIISKIDK